MKNEENYAKEHDFDAEGNLILDMMVKDDENFLSVFSNENTPIISEEVSSFLETSAEGVPHKQSLALKIHSDCIDEQEKELYVRGIQKYYANRLATTKRELHRNVWVAVVLAVMGVAILALAHTVEAVFHSVIWAEAIDIAAWVLLWESVDILVFKIHSLRLDSRRYSAFYAMPIEFVPFGK